MKAILTAAGMGSRISRHTDKPKSAMDVGGKPLIRKTVEMLISHGIRVSVVTGYKSEIIESALSGLDVTFYHNPYYRVTNSIASLWFAKGFIDDDTIIANADVFWGEDIFDIIETADDEINILADKTCAEQGDYLFKLNGDLVEKYGKDIPEKERDTEYVGIAKIKKSFAPTFISYLDELVAKDKYDLWWENVLYENCKTNPIHVKDVSGCFWAEIDYIEDYMRIQDYLKTGDVKSKYKTYSSMI